MRFWLLLGTLTVSSVLFGSKSFGQANELRVTNTTAHDVVVFVQYRSQLLDVPLAAGKTKTLRLHPTRDQRLLSAFEAVGPRGGVATPAKIRAFTRFQPFWSLRKTLVLQLVDGPDPCGNWIFQTPYSESNDPEEGGPTPIREANGSALQSESDAVRSEAEAVSEDEALPRT